MTYRTPTAVHEQIRVDSLLCRAFDKRPGESLEEAAKRTAADPDATTRLRWAARTLLSSQRTPWEAMFSAARIIEGATS